MEETASPPQTASGLRDLILERYDGLSKRLQHVAGYVLDHADDVALETLTLIAERSGAQPSAIVRFAKSLGYTGAGPMQRVLRDSLLANHSTLGYGDRVRRFAAGRDEGTTRDVGALLDEFAEGDILALQNLRETIGQDALAQAVQLLDKAETVFVVGMRRSFPVAAYLAYSFLQLGKKAVLVDNVGGLAAQQMTAIGPRDLAFAISFQSHAPETVDAVATASRNGAPILSITDSLISPIAKPATQALLVRESEVRSFRSLSASICLAQTLMIGLAYARERPKRRKKE